ncbi:TetR/AcrR family transcriptional regulator [Pedomonas sp. V897]|uniref:TetR/AcrR family transcriptional regulator n=1 Tax=Pedomonas sp. V897 TaxID=3446482 RepID=UPI003EDE8BAE
MVHSLASPRKHTLSPRLSPRQRDRRERVLRTARNLITTHGLQEVTMRMIAAGSGVTEKTLYNIYGSKDRLIAATAYDITASIFQEARDACAESGWGFIVALVDALVDGTLVRPNTARTLIPILLDHAEAVGIDALYDEFFGSTLMDMKQSGAILDTAPVPMITRLVRIAAVTSILFWGAGQLRDSEVRPHILVQLCGLLRPWAAPTLIPALDRELAQAHRQLGA